MASIRGTLRQRADVLLPELDEWEVENLVMDTVGSISEWYWAQFKAVLKDEDTDALRRNFNDFVAARGNVKFPGLFIDEAQDIEPKVIELTYLLGEIVNCGADRAQDLQGHYTEPADELIFKLLNDQEATRRQGLSRNFRNTRKIFEFARQFVPEDITVQEIDLTGLDEGDKPEIYQMTQDEQFALILKIVVDSPNSNIGILLHTGPQIDLLKDFFESNGYLCDGTAPENMSFSYYKHIMPNNDRLNMETRLQTPFILTFDSCKGLEFDIVIMPLFDKSDWALATAKRKRDGTTDFQADGTPKMYATRNHYYVAATRARRTLYLMYEHKPGIISFYQEDEEDDLPF
ncbi:hypothetical protein GCM10011425_16630 [Mucilaginibacter galii]|uniref:DNA 3'-5' helicase II n=2 Tax=Mucilaginibacter galii TaxID=2005073 RepID=A0A917N118_9SPHI|nr:hypothetical protein GCM10011425_16630 [Mucilaginibacter galii]